MRGGESGHGQRVMHSCSERDAVELLGRMDLGSA